MIAPPTNNNPNMSYTDKSKLNSDNANTLSLSVILNLVFTASIVFNTPLWLIVTPLGVPVEPEVNITYAISSGFISGKVIFISLVCNLTLFLI